MRVFAEIFVDVATFTIWFLLSALLMWYCWNYLEDRFSNLPDLNYIDMVFIRLLIRNVGSAFFGSYKVTK